MIERLYWINGGRFCFGVVTQDDIVKEAPPCAARFKGRQISSLLDQWSRAEVRIIDQKEI